MKRLAMISGSVSARIAGGMEIRIYFATLGGFDTHSNQAGNHANLLRTLSDGLLAFQRDLEQQGLSRPGAHNDLFRVRTTAH